MRETIINHKHPVEGFLSLISDGEHITLQYRWPFDRKENDWFTLTDSYDYGTYVDEIQRLILSGRATLIGRFGRVDLTTPSSSNTQVEFVFTVESNPHQIKVDSLSVDVPPRELLPTRADNSTKEI